MKRILLSISFPLAGTIKPSDYDVRNLENKKSNSYK